MLRPLENAPFGRTVLSWYKNLDAHSQRVTTNLRMHTCNILGIRLGVCGIPWQQQDRGVSACATIALWSMFHSSAFDAHHSVPTTVSITQNALGATSGSRAFPSQGLTIPELLEAVFAQNLTPKLFKPRVIKDGISGFEKNYLASMCAANIRSGYPVLLVGDYLHQTVNERHAICCVGFREKEQEAKAPNTFTTMDGETEIFYIHDDNIGPNIRCKLVSEDGFAVLETSPPEYLTNVEIQPATPYKFRPLFMLIAVHEEIRMDADSLVGQAAKVAYFVNDIFKHIYKDEEVPAISYNSQFCDVRSFFSTYLSDVFGSTPTLLSKVRLDIGERAPPLCLHIGLVSLATIVNGNVQRTMDIIYDTTDSALKCPAIAYIVYDLNWKSILDYCDPEELKKMFGVQIIGY